MIVTIDETGHDDGAGSVDDVIPLNRSIENPFRIPDRDDFSVLDQHCTGNGSMWKKELESSVENEFLFCHFFCVTID